MTVSFVVVGIGADGWRGLADTARDELSGASLIYGSARQLDTLPDIDAQLRPWSSPMSEHLRTVLGTSEGGVVHILASGDPMFHGVGTTVVRAVGADRVRVLPAVSSASLACARLGWDLAAAEVVSLVRNDVETLLDVASDGRDILVLSRDASTPAEVAALLTANGFGWSSFTVLEQLGGDREQIVRGVAHSWDRPAGDALNIVAIGCVGPVRSRAPGRPDAEYANDGQLTKAPIRALTVAALQPGHRELLWDIGSGSGSVAIEWLRTEPSVRAIAFERDPDRAARLAANATTHGVAGRLTVLGAVPDDWASTPDPDTVFIGGGVDEEVLTHVWSVLPAGGRLVVNAVTVENQTLLAQWYARHGGTLRRVAIDTAGALGSMTAWRPALPIVQWAVDRP